MLNNGNVIDTSTFIQSLSSALFSHLPFVNTVPGGSFFSVHGSPILFLLLPFYAVLPSFVSLYIILNIVNYFPSIPLFLMAKKSLRSEKLAFLYGFSYLFYPFIYTYPFEVLTLFSGLFIFAFYFYTERKWVQFFILFALSLSTIEFSPIVGAFFTFYLIAERISKKELVLKRSLALMLKSYWLEISVFLVSVIFFLIEKDMISYFSLSSHSVFSNIYGTDPFSLKSIINGITDDPQGKLNYLVLLNMPFLFLSFLDPILILELPWLLVTFISVFGPYWDPYVYYASYVTPFVVLGFLKGVDRIKNMMNSKAIKKIFQLSLAINVLVWVAVDGLTMFYSSPVYPVSPQNQAYSS